MTRVRYISIPVTPFQQNCTLLWCENTHKAAIVDPGGDIDQLLAAAEHQRVEVERILLTHGHLDHAGGAMDLAQRLSVPIEGPHEGDRYWLDGMPQQCRMFGVAPLPACRPDRWFAAGDEVKVGDVVLAVRHCPGHTPGHIVFFDAKSRTVLVGDVLFAGSIGRTDFPGGDLETLLGSIRNELFTLGDDVTFIPGHGPNSTIGTERRSNPFVADQSSARRS